MAKQKILIVDDESFYIEVIENLLHEDYDILIAHNGYDAIKLVQCEDKPDLILLDIMMEGIDGYEVCRCLKSDEQSKHIPIIFLTVKSDVDDEVLGFNLGAVDYITKPISPPIVRARVNNHIEILRLRKELEVALEKCKQ
ncbi:MAG: response regulator [Gammaproteobacteria bacterium]|nr:response regulator [Gammaproteobacteria bacterium]